MSQRERKQRELRARLEAELRLALEKAGASERVIDSVMAAGCRLDGVGAMGVSQELASANARLSARVREVVDALERLERRTYGHCASCGERIDAERLDLLPTTTLCRDCAAM
jgi:RNA polymerase-binding transcription factor DksA